MENTPITVTLGEIGEFKEAAKLFLNQKDLKPSHLSLALSKMLKILKPHIDDYEDLISERRIDFAQKDKEGVIEIQTTGQYKMKADGAKKFQVAVRDIASTEIEITPYYAKSLPKNISLPWYEYFVPFVIEDYPEPIED